MCIKVKLISESMSDLSVYLTRKITLTTLFKDADSNVSVTHILLQKLKHALTHKSLSMDNYNFTSLSISFYE